MIKNFYPRPPRGGRPPPSKNGQTGGYFYPRPPRGGRPYEDAGKIVAVLFLSTPSARRATNAAAEGIRRIYISIHALREEGDAWSTTRSSCGQDFYPRPPRGGRQVVSVRGPADPEFLSTPSARRATNCPQPADAGFDISIHALREEGDSWSRWLRSRDLRFLSTPSARRATSTNGNVNIDGKISIHALREEGDPCRQRCRRLSAISIHALREEGDLLEGFLVIVDVDFYPRPPRGGRQQKQRQKLYFQTNYTTFCTNLEEP